MEILDISALYVEKELNLESKINSIQVFLVCCLYLLVNLSQTAVRLPESSKEVQKRAADASAADLPVEGYDFYANVFSIHLLKLLANSLVEHLAPHLGFQATEK